MACNGLVIFACVLVYVNAHGRLNIPPNRASLWRFGYDSPPNYDDVGMNCGGFSRQYQVNNGRCGICGDAFDRPQPRPHELGGRYGKGFIVARYEEGQTINSNIFLSTSHMGFWELRICPDPLYQDQKCFDNGYLLEREDGGTKYYPTRGDGSYDVNYRLPAGLTCEHCVLQWQYTAGNNWGVCPNRTQGLGCGNQEQFYSCADISIRGSSGSVVLNEIVDDVEDTDSYDSPSHYSALNPIELELLIRRLKMAGFRVFTGNQKVTSPNSAKKRKKKNHRKKKNKKTNSKRHKKVRRTRNWRACMNCLMTVEEARAVCKVRRSWRAVDTAYSEEKKA